MNRTPALRFRPTRREAVYLLALMALVVVIEFATLPRELTGPDATTYVAIAREQLTEPGFWSDPASFVGNFWAVAYPTILAVVLRFTGDDLTSVVIVQSLLMATLVVVPWVLARGLPRTVQLGAPAVLALCPALWWMGRTIGYEALLAWLIGVATALAWILASRGVRPLRWSTGLMAVGVGLLMAAALLTQSKVLVIVPVLGYLVYRAGRAPFVIATVAFLAGLLPWMVRNLLVLGTPSPLTANAGYNLWVGSNPDAVNGGSMLIAPATPPGETMTSAALQFIISQPERWIELTWSKAARLLQPVFIYPDQVPPGPARTALHFYAGLIAVLLAIGVIAFAGAWLLRGRRAVPPVAPLALIVVLWFASHLPFIAESRYLTSVLPITVTVAVAAWVAIAQRLTGRTGGDAAAAHAQVQELERRGMPTALDLAIPSWRRDGIVVDAAVIEPSATLVVPAQACGLPEEQHSWPDLMVRTLANVVLDVDSGLVFAGDRVIAQSGTGTRASRDAAFVSGATFRVQEAQPTEIRGAVAPLGDVHHHYHVMLETIPRLLHARRYRPDVTFVTSATIPDRYRELLERWGVRVRQLPEGAVIRPEACILVDQPELFWPRRADVDALRAAFRDESDTSAMDSRIYVSRRHAARSLADELQLEEVLRASGFEIVVLEEHDIASQMRIMRGAETVVSPHGAGLVGITMLPQTARVFEISSGEVFEECYRRLAALVSVSYVCVRLSGSPDLPFGDAHEASTRLASLLR